MFAIAISRDSILAMVPEESLGSPIHLTCLHYALHSSCFIYICVFEGPKWFWAYFRLENRREGETRVWWT